jgi:hypothetical protein
MFCEDIVSPLVVKTLVTTHALTALTMIDIAIGWFGIDKAANKSVASF